MKTIVTISTLLIANYFLAIPEKRADYPNSFLAVDDIIMDSLIFDEYYDLSAEKKKEHTRYYSFLNIPGFKYDDYKRNAQEYLNRPLFKGTPITGEIMANCAVRTYLKHKILVPLPLVLAQGQFESKMGTKGRSPKNNPFNIGEYDGKTVIKFNSTENGVQAYFNIIASRYLISKSISQLMNNFTNLNAHRYASDPNYEKKLKRQMGYIKRYLNINDQPVKRSTHKAIAMF